MDFTEEKYEQHFSPTLDALLFGLVLMGASALTLALPFSISIPLPGGGTVGVLHVSIFALILFLLGFSLVVGSNGFVIDKHCGIVQTWKRILFEYGLRSAILADFHSIELSFEQEGVTFFYCVNLSGPNGKFRIFKNSNQRPVVLQGQRIAEFLDWPLHQSWDTSKIIDRDLLGSE